MKAVDTLIHQPTPVFRYLEGKGTDPVTARLIQALVEGWDLQDERILRWVMGERHLRFADYDPATEYRQGIHWKTVEGELLEREEVAR